MNRESHLKQTIEHNLAVMRSYYYEYLILDYSSDSDAYIKELAKDPRLTCYRVNDMKYYHHSHAKNVISKLATGDILIHIDADNWVSADFLENVVYILDHDLHKYICNADNVADMFGRICISRENFMKLSGYDEHFNGWGFEDTDFVWRARAMGLQYIVIDESLIPIVHSNEERVINTKYPDIKDIESVAETNVKIVHYNVENGIIAPNKEFGVADVIKL